MCALYGCVVCVGVLCICCVCALCVCYVCVRCVCGMCVVCVCVCVVCVVCVVVGESACKCVRYAPRSSLRKKMTPRTRPITQLSRMLKKTSFLVWGTEIGEASKVRKETYASVTAPVLLATIDAQMITAET